MSVEEVLGTKLSILIEDFRDFKGEQKKFNNTFAEHEREEERLISKLATTIQWHTVIGTFITGVLMYLLYRGTV